jgi:uncharacterized protein
VKLRLSNKRGVFISLLILFCLCIVAAAGLFFSALADNALIINTNERSLPADPGSTCFYTISYANPLRALFFPFNGNYSLEFEEGGGLVTTVKKQGGFFIQSTGQSGTVVFNVNIAGFRQGFNLRIDTDTADTDGDGFPDAVELDSPADRDSFRRWFVSIAESQFYAPSYSWYDIHRDCAGLVVFSFKEALKKHGTDWLKNFPYLVKQDIPDVRKYHYPRVPLLGDRIFRTAGGGFAAGDVKNGGFAPVADVNTLINHNLTFIGKDPEDFAAGDILFFLHTDNPDMPFHSMIYTGRDGWLVYHTGPLDDKSEGEVRKVRLTDLLLHPDRSWAPVADNPCFLGAFRWNILM